MNEMNNIETTKKDLQYLGFSNRDGSPHYVYFSNNFPEVQIDISLCKDLADVNIEIGKSFISYGMTIQKQVESSKNQGKKISIKNKVTLTQLEIEHVVNEWYLNGSFPLILQDEFGNDLEEILDVDYSIEVETIK